MVDAAWEKAAIYFPFADVIMSKPCAVFEEEGLSSAFYVGQSTVVGGTTTDMVAVAGGNVQATLERGEAMQIRIGDSIRQLTPAATVQ